MIAFNYKMNKYLVCSLNQFVDVRKWPYVRSCINIISHLLAYTSGMYRLRLNPDCFNGNVLIRFRNVWSLLHRLDSWWRKETLL